MSALRQDPASGDWVLIAPERGRRPRERPADAAAARALPGHDPACPFCPGNEAMLPEIIDETPAPDPPGWRTRVVPNKFPAVTPAGAAAASLEGAGATRPGYGRHEVIIESPRHDASLPLLSDADAAAVVGTYRRRAAALLEEPRIETALVFRNHGSRAGASLRHPHAQAIALDVVPPPMCRRERWARERFEQAGRCVLCALAEAEQSDGARMVEASEAFVAFVPFAAAHPFETWIVPRGHRPAFAATDPGEDAALAAILRSVLGRLSNALGDPAYNFVIDSAGRGAEDAPHLHWRLRIAPDLIEPGGFELGTGLAINPGLPEDDAAALRAAKV